MFGKIKKVFFTGVFGILYISFIVQLIYILVALDDCGTQMLALATLSVEWLVLIAARYLSKRSASSNTTNVWKGKVRIK